MKEIKLKDLRQFGIILGVIFCVIGGIHFIKGHGVYRWFLGSACVSVFLGAFYPGVIKPFYIVFTKIAHAIGWFNTRVILILVYYLILTPIGLVMRLFGGDPLSRKFDKSAGSYWIKRPAAAATKESLEKQF